MALSPDQLQSLIASPETWRVEKTRWLADADKAGEAICAFANDIQNSQQPGYLLVGVGDDGSLSGLSADEKLLQTLASFRDDGRVAPRPSLTVEKHALAGGDIAVVEVWPSDLTPVRYKGVIHVRSAARRSHATPEEEKRLAEKRIASAREFDSLPCREAALSDLSRTLFEAYRDKAVDPDVIAENSRTFEEQLAGLGFFDTRYGCPTYGGLLVAAARPRRFLRGAYVQFVRIGGAGVTDPVLDEAEIEGDAATVARECEMRIRVFNRKGLRWAEDSAFREVRVPDYPEWAVRELLVNALTHRDYECNTPVYCFWYDDRIEIKSPGGLYGKVTPENFGRQTGYRNPLLAAAIKTLGYINRYGHGIPRVRQLLAEAGHPPPEFSLEAESVGVIVRIAKNKLG